MSNMIEAVKINGRKLCKNKTNRYIGIRDCKTCKYYIDKVVSVFDSKHDNYYILCSFNKNINDKINTAHSKITRLLSEEPDYDYPNNFSNWSTIMQSCYWDGINEMKKQQTAMLMELATILEEKK